MTSTVERVLDAATLERWRRHGYVHLPDLLTPEVRERLATWADDVAHSDDERLLQHHEMTDHGPALARTEHFATVHPELGALILDGPISRAGEQLLGEPVVLYKEKINHKLPGGAGFAPHQDAAAYRFVGTHLTCMVAIDDATIDNGCLDVVAGCHHELIVDDGDGCLPPSAERALTWQPVEMRAGDVLWFHSRTPHRSGPNTSTSSRRALFLTYNAAADGDLRSAYYADKIDRLRHHVGDDRARVSTIGHFLGRAVSDDQPRNDEHRNDEHRDDEHRNDEQPDRGHDAMTEQHDMDEQRTVNQERGAGGAPVPWMHLRTASDVAAAIVDLYERRGDSHYDEVVSQLAHALQSGGQAMDHRASADAIVAAFLHDIGHLLVDEHDGNGDFLARDLHHEDVGARFLANWFGPAVTEPIRLHVPAKRYLCAVDPTYRDGLSEASKRSLEVQGGPMTDDEVAEFEALDGFETAVDLRRWDDLAKVDNAPTVSLDTFRTLIECVVKPSAA
ncbi:putative oxygenase [Ilumatobacter coccineus YM16-304]|uniref:Putative oxygenase n=2 Tax=Ilumatobacter coccineus TaxID=467094 RepID=A0A6C7EEJ8_ILUCY|nr:putative oxygenase [Ilumatobacter coccineus YM16-304]